MPDANKFAKLRSIGFKILRTCGSCVHGQFSSPASQWGTCGLYKYEHKKHTGPARGVSVVKDGSCGMHERADSVQDNYGAHAEFVR